ncbi:unnamed protein product, partial [Symbiodinium natans]
QWCLTATIWFKETVTCVDSTVADLLDEPGQPGQPYLSVEHPDGILHGPSWSVVPVTDFDGEYLPKGPIEAAMHTTETLADAKTVA